MGSSTSFRDAWTTRSVTVGIPSLRSFPLFFGIITCRTGTGRNSPDFSKPPISSRNAPTPIPLSLLAGRYEEQQPELQSPRAPPFISPLPVPDSLPISLPHRDRPELTGLQQAPDLLQERPHPDPVLDAGR